jgi:uncharacterized membrane protein (UPF0127 family)
MARAWLSYLAQVCLLAALFSGTGCTRASCPVDNETTRLSINGHVLTVELATTPASLHCGLAFRDTLAADRGMLFVFGREREVRFWMKDTRIPLSIAFLDADGIIVALADMDPAHPERRYPSGVPVRYALETNRGWFAARDIRRGDRAAFILPPGAPAGPDARL